MGIKQCFDILFRKNLRDVISEALGIGEGNPRKGVDGSCFKDLGGLQNGGLF